MPPKGKKGKKSGKGKKKKEPEISFQEAVFAYRIGLTEKQIDDWKFEEKTLEEQAERLTERNQRLMEEQDQYTKLLLKQSREFDKKSSEAEKIGKGKVMEALQDKWVACKEEEQRLEEMQADILNLERMIARLKREKNKWMQYKEKGSKERSHQITLLEKELADMGQSFEEMADHLARNVEYSKERIITHMERTLTNQKHSASEQAMATLDKKNRQEVLDNDWMLEEVNRYEEQCDKIAAEVADVERENLALMEELFESNVEDLQITRNLFLTQFGEDETLADGGILEVDLKSVSLLERQKRGTSASSQPHIDPSGFEKRLAVYQQEGEEEFYDEDDEMADLYDELALNNYYSFGNEDLENYLQLGPLELKLLSVTGESKPVYRLDDTEEGETAREYNPAEWPVTQPMLKEATTPIRPHMTAIEGL